MNFVWHSKIDVNLLLLLKQILHRFNSIFSEIAFFSVKSVENKQENVHKLWSEISGQGENNWNSLDFFSKFLQTFSLNFDKVFG
jgi:hypothetical protein